MNSTVKKVVYWIKGNPQQAGWYFVTYLINDKPEKEVTTEYLWFNNDAIPKWWIGTAGKCLPFDSPITHHMVPPTAAKDLK